MGQAQPQVMGQHVHHDQGIPVGVLGLLGPLAVHRGVQFPVRHHVGHPTGQGLLQPLMRDPRQGARDGGGVGRMIPEDPQGLLQSRPVHPGEEGDVGHGGLTADQAQQGQTQNGLKGMSDPSGHPGVRHLLQALEQRFLRLHNPHTSHLSSLPYLCKPPSPTLQSSWC